MFEDYSVLVRLSLQNQVSAGLLGLSSQFTKLNAQAAAFQARLKSIKVMALTGFGLAAVGFFGLHLIDKAIKPAEEYAHQLNILNMAGLTQKEIAEAVGAAWKNTGSVITTTATENLRMLNDMRIVFGRMDEAQLALPLVSKMQAILMSSREGRGAASDKDFAFSVAKALDIIGAVKNKQEFEKEAVMMAQTVTAFQGRVTPKMFQSTFAYARQAKYALDNEFKYQFLPTLMMEYALSGSGAGGGSRGVGPMLAAMYRFTNQGYINKKSLPELKSLGLVDAHTALKTTTTGTTVGPMTNYQLAGRDPFLWVQQTLVPALEKKYGANLNRDQLQFHINQIARGNQLAASLITEFAVKAYAFYRDQTLIQKAMTPEQAYQRALINDPQLARLALADQWENVETALTTPIVTILMPALVLLARGLNSFAEVLVKYPALATTLSYAFLGLSVTLAFSGIVLLLTAAFKGLSLAMSIMAIPLSIIGIPILGIAAALGMIGFAAYQTWQILKNMDWREVGKEFSLLWDMIKNGIKSVLGILSGLFSSFIGWLKSHIPGGSFILGKGGDQTQAAGSVNAQKQALNAHNLNPVKSGNIGTVQVHSVVNLNGRAIGQAVTEHQVAEATRTQNYSSRFDTNMTPTPPLLKLATY